MSWNSFPPLCTPRNPAHLGNRHGSQYTSAFLKTFAGKYKFRRVTSTPYCSQSNGRTEAAVKSAKHILHTAEDIDLALLAVRNTAPAGLMLSPAQRLYRPALRTDLPQLGLILWTCQSTDRSNGRRTTSPKGSTEASVRQTCRSTTSKAEVEGHLFSMNILFLCKYCQPFSSPLSWRNHSHPDGQINY